MECDMIIRQVSSLLNFDDLKTMRLISKKWHRVVSCHRKFNEKRWTQITASNGINRDLGHSFNKALALPWSKVHLHKFYAVERGNFMKHLWPDMSGAGNVTQLFLSSVKIGCGDACSLLNNAPGLTHVAFINVKFNPNYACKQGQPPVQTLIYCTHLEEMRDEEYERLTRTNVPAPTITTLSIQKQDSFPFCVMENLINRTRGTLIQFSMYESPTPRTRRIPHTFIPIWDELCPQILQLIRASSTSLKLIYFLKCGFGLYEFLDNNVQNYELQLNDLALGTSVDSLKMNLPATLRNGNLMIGLVQKFPNFLQSLSLKIVYHEATRNELQNALIFLANLKILYIEFVISTLPEDPISINLPRTLMLKEFAFHYRSPNRRRAFYNEFLNYDFLENMDTTSLEFLILDTNLYVRDQITQYPLNFGPFMVNMLDIGQFRQLKKVCFWSGFSVTNCLLQSIIDHLPQLEELYVDNAAWLCDAGIVGVRQVQGTCPFCEEDPPPVGHGINEHGHPISELAKLKILRLSLCCITDISLNAFNFPKLLQINLVLCSKITDNGLLALGQNNPKLETLILGYNPSITFQGIREFLTISRSIKKIFMSANEIKLEPLDPMYNGIITLL